MATDASPTATFLSAFNKVRFIDVLPLLTVVKPSGQTVGLSQAGTPGAIADRVETLLGSGPIG
jgi:hypothetical protein